MAGGARAPLAAAAALALWACAPSATAQAQDDAITRAREALRDGHAAHAVALLEAAQQTSTEPRLELELSIACEQAGRRRDAAAHLAIYLDAESNLSDDVRATLEGQLQDLRARLEPAPSRGVWSDPAMPVVGWTLLGGGIAGLLTFLGGTGAALAFEGALDEPCRMARSLCAPGERAEIDTAWTAAWAGLAAGVPLAALGAAFLALAGQAEEGSSRSLPPELDPTQGRPLSMAPWTTPDGAGLRVGGSF